MIIVNKIGNSITGSVNGERYGITFSEEKYAKMQELEAKSQEVATRDEYNAIVEEFKPLTVESYKDTVETACPYIHINPATGKFYLKDGDKVSTFAMPQSFVDRIMKSLEKNIDVLPLIKFWTRLLRNPNLTETKAERLCNYIAKTYIDRELVDKLIEEEGVSYEVAVERATSIQTPITKEGLLCTYKVSREIKHKYILDENGNRQKVDRYDVTKEIDDITGEITETEAVPAYVEDRIFEPAVVGQGHDAFFCDGVLGHTIRVGAKHSLESWDQVDTRDHVSCVKGLHVGNLDYIDGYMNDNTETHNIFIDPRHVGAITDNGSGALRVKEYYVYDSFAGVCKNMYHSSTYAQMSDAEWAVERQAAIAEIEAIKAEFDQVVADMAN